MTEKLLEQINSIDGVIGTLSFGGATVYRAEKKLSVVFRSSSAQPKDLPEKIENLLRKNIPASFSAVEVSVSKIVTRPEFVEKSVKDYFSENHKIIAQAVKEGCVTTERTGDVVSVVLSCETSVYEYLTERRIDDALKDHLEKEYSDKFEIIFKDTGFVDADENKLVVRDPYTPATKKARTFKVSEVTKFMEEDPTDTATYICDAKEGFGEVYLAGTISNVNERLSKNEKPYFIIDFSDRTGSVSGAVFPNKDKVPKLRKLDRGVDIIVRGEFQMRNGFKNFRIYNVNLCVFPQNFVPKEREKQKVADGYALIFPKPYEYETQDNFLIDKSVPSCFSGRTFVVFDLETTGVDHDDKMTEIGAVKIVDGKMTEYFTTLINPQKHIPSDVVALTGIDDEMVKTAPLFEEVCSDFYKFCYGATLVGHNVEFDIRFVRNQAKPLDFEFDNFLMDTLEIGRENVKGVANYKLNTLCDLFGIKFRHHRAMSDAAATAELFIELIRLKGKMPF